MGTKFHRVSETNTSGLRIHNLNFFFRMPFSNSHPIQIWYSFLKSLKMNSSIEKSFAMNQATQLTYPWKLQTSYFVVRMDISLIVYILARSISLFFLFFPFLLVALKTHLFWFIYNLNFLSARRVSKGQQCIIYI